MLKNKLIATARCHPTEKADNHGVAEGEDGYFNGTTGLHVGIHFCRLFLLELFRHIEKYPDMKALRGCPARSDQRQALPALCRYR